MDYFFHISILISIYIIVGISLNLVAGYAGLLSLSHAGFYGIGAYTAALLSLNLGVSFLLTIPAAILVASLFGLRDRRVATWTVLPFDNLLHIPFRPLA